MKHIKDYILIILFILIISFPLLDYILPIASTEFKNRENRYYAEFPGININRLDAFPRQFENFYNDNFHYRGELLELNNFVKLNIYKESPHTAVIMGKDGWLYTQKYINSYTSKRIFNKTELDSLRKIFIQRSEWLKQRNIKNYMVIIPTKYNVYPEYLPNSVYKLRLTNEKDQFIECISNIDNLKVNDLEPVLKDWKKKSKIRLFQKTDQHWNEYGAFVAYTNIIEELHKDFPEIPLVNSSDFKIDSLSTPGKELAYTILLEDKVTEQDIKVSPVNPKSIRIKAETEYPVPEKFPYKHSFQLEYKTDSTNLPKIMLLRDSYSNSILHLIPESFSRTVFIWDNWCYRLNEDIVKGEKPDIYMTFLIESNIPYILHKHPSER